MFKKIFIVSVAVFGMGFIACSKNYCDKLAEQTCKKVPGTKACQKAKTLTNKAVCKSYLANIDKYIKLTNLKVDTPPLKPPKVQQKKEQKPANDKAVPVAGKDNDTKAGSAAKDVQKSATAPAAKATEKPAATKTVPTGKPSK